MSKYKVKPLSPEGLKTYSLFSRKSKVAIKDFARPFPAEESFRRWLRSLPEILAGRDFKDFLSAMAEAKKKRKAILFALGAHVVKVGLSPVIIDLMKEGWITGLALNGAGVIHDFEIAFAGKTSEDVGLQVKKGQFGMAQETGEMVNEAISSSEKEGLGLGQAVARMIASSDFPYKEASLLCAAYRLNIPLTVHVAVGLSLIHISEPTRPY